MRVKQIVLRLSLSVCATVPGIIPFPTISAILLEDVGGANNKEVVVIKDDRATNIDEYFASMKLPLSGHGKTFVAAADKYDLDYRLLPAIAMRESTGGKKPCPYGNEANVFGWHSCKTKFLSYEQSIDKVAAHLAGEIKSTRYYYGNKTVWKKLRTYNSVIEAYPGEVIAIMNKIDKMPIDEQAKKVDTKIETKELAMR